MPRRRAYVLLPIEEAILEVGLRRELGGDAEFHGFALAKELESADAGSRLLGHGTLYKALSRLERDGLLDSRWEEIQPVDEGRPRRRLYRVTGSAGAALARSRQERATTPKRAPKWVPA
jgi:DNA-binding PadR family transcriptional regulator